MQIITITGDWFEGLSRALILMRDNSKITKTELAVECGYSQQTLSCIEHGKLSTMNVKFWDKVARSLHYRLEIRFVPSSYLGPRIVQKVEALQKENVGIWTRAIVASFYPDIEPDFAEKIAEILNTAESSETQLAEATAYEVEIENGSR
jgi:DNA-binding XRE family transcriptional regulator